MASSSEAVRAAAGGDQRLRLRQTEWMDNRDPVVEAWFEMYDNPQKDLVRAVRQVILNVDPRISETIKWKAPTFMFNGNIASFYPRTTKHVSLMFTPGRSCLIRRDCLRATVTPHAWRGF